jgi:hypothetical protein
LTAKTFEKSAEFVYNFSMSDEGRIRLSAVELDKYVNEMIAQHGRGNILVQTPIYSGPFPIDALRKLKRLVDNAHHARIWHARYGPPWTQPLPVSELERFSLLDGTDKSRHLLAYYSESLDGRDYNYLEHPQFFDHGRAVMADPRTPEYLREDADLQILFPPKPLAGLDEHQRWRPLPDRISQLLPVAPAPWLPGTITWGLESQSDCWI